MDPRKNRYMNYVRRPLLSANPMSPNYSNLLTRAMATLTTTANDTLSTLASDQNATNNTLLNDRTEISRYNTLVVKPIGSSVDFNGTKYPAHKIQNALVRVLSKKSVKRLVFKSKSFDPLVSRLMGDPLITMKEKLDVRELEIDFDALGCNLGSVSSFITTLSGSLKTAAINNITTKITGSEAKAAYKASLEMLMDGSVYPLLQQTKYASSFAFQINIPNLIRSKTLLQIIAKYPMLKSLKIGLPDFIEMEDIRILTQILNDNPLETIRLHLNMEDLDEMMHSHKEDSRALVKYLSLSPRVSEMQTWGARTAVRALDMYPNLREIDLNCFTSGVKWDPFVIQMAVGNALRMLPRRSSKNMEFRLPTSASNNIPYVLAAIPQVTGIRTIRKNVYEIQAVEASVILVTE